MEVSATIMHWAGLKSHFSGARARPSSRLGAWIEAVLLLALAIQLARLIWTILTPTGAYGDWHGREPVVTSPAARLALFSAFDPFYRAAAPGASGNTVQQVTSLPLQLFGIRVNEATGQGSAIIADQAGLQRSYAVGEEIAPGVRLKAVTYDHVVIDRGGAQETLYIDQSGDAPVAAPASPGQPAAILPSGGGAPAAALDFLSGIAFAPRNEGGRVTGIVVNAQGNPAIFAQAGFRNGDVIAQVNGRPVTGSSDVVNLQNAILPGARLSLMVERGSATVPIALIIPDKQ